MPLSKRGVLPGIYLRQYTRNSRSASRRSNRRAAPSASSPAAPRRPTTTNACRAFATRSGVTGTTPPGEPLTGQNGWTEAAGCPLYTNDDFPLAVQQFQDFMGANPDVDAFVPTGGFPQFIPDANRAAVESYKGQIAEGSLALVVADTLPTQIEQLKEGFSPGQVGQRPFEMGYQVVQAFQQMADGGAARADPTYTGLDICTPEMADTCIAR